MLKRIFDILVSLFLLVLLSPAFILIALLIVFDSRGGVFYYQTRVGRYGMDFNLLKFRSMRSGSDKRGLLTVGARDARITRIGYYLRKYKLDELPQLLNVLAGNMSMVGPRPEVRRYVDLYNDEQRKVLELKPGITDYASIAYINENELLAKSNDPEKTYVDEVMPVKLELNKIYVENCGLSQDLKILGLTLIKIFRNQDSPVRK
jgi:lipopolysaccharide/colanic/teichoic acid biosynthesis glycosyltransferase